MADPNGVEASASVPAQEDDYAYRSFHEYRWDLDKDFLVSQPVLSPQILSPKWRAPPI